MSDTLTPFTQWDPHFFPKGDGQPDAEGLVWLYDAEGEKLLKVDPRRWQVVAAALELAYEAVQTVGGALWTDEEAAENLQQLAVRSMTYPMPGGR